MAINYELLNSGAMTVGGGFNLYSKNPLDARLVIPALEGLQNLIDNAAAYEGMIAYISSEKKHYEVKTIDGVLSYRQFGLTNDELNELITNATTAAMEFKGVTATLPADPAKGDMYKVSGETIDITIDGVAAKVGDSIVYNGEEWFLIPSGDDIEDTWRPITDVANDASLTFVDGDKIDAVVAENGTIKFNHEKLSAAPTDIATEDDKKTRTYLTAVEVDEFGHVTNYKTATENVEDTDTTYEFECQVEEGHSNVHFSVKASDAEQAQEICLDAYTRNETDGKISDAVKVVTDAIATDRAVWDLAGTAVQTSNFNTFKEENTQAIADAVAPKLDKSVYDAYIDGKSMSDADLKKYAEDEADAAQVAAEGTAHNELEAYKLVVAEELAKKQNNIPENTYDAYGSAAQALQDAKDYANSLEHKDTTYSIAPTANALEFTVTPSEGAAQTVTLVAPEVNTGVMEVAAGNDIVVTPGENGKVTVAHEEFVTGEYTKDPASSEKTGDQYFFTGVTVDNGHVIGANVKSLASVLEAMTFIFDGGTSAN